ncbi:HD domain-containing protein [Amycolatopsis sp. lyj-23]|uniref:HD domain-containing protein n=1 Tax=Amycolatopsis sp. lyj-23 TaxID=2789283 RepID=UPI00397E3E0D
MMPKGPKAAPTAESLIQLLGDVVLPMYGIERTILAPTNPPRLENDAEHSFSLGIAACCFAPLVDPLLEVGLVAQYALVHDLVEVYAGDTSVYADATDRAAKVERERAAFDRIVMENQNRCPWLTERLDAYIAAADPEGRFVHAMDKLLPHAVVLLADAHPLRRTWDDYLESERVAAAKISRYFPALLPLFTQLCRMFAERPHLFSDRSDAEASDE